MTEATTQNITLERRWMVFCSFGMIIVSLVFLGVAIIFGATTRRVWDDTAILAIIYTPLIMMPTGVIGIMSVRAMHREVLVGFMRLTIVFSFVVALLGIIELWWGVAFAKPLLSQSPEPWASMAIVAISMVICGQLLVPTVKSSIVELIRRGVSFNVALFVAAVIGLMWSWPAWQPWVDLVQMLSTFWGACTLLALVVIALVINSMNARSKPRHESLPSKLTLRMTCPDCNDVQTLRTGLSRCGACGYTMIIEIEEPRCECGYLIYKLQGDTCPECGKAIDSKHQWPQSHATPVSSPAEETA